MKQPCSTQVPQYELIDVHMRYGKRCVLHINQLRVMQGETLALVGPSGAGKSTLLRMLALLEAPSAGRVSLHLDGQSLDHQSVSIEQKRRLAMVFQRPVLLSCSVRANVAHALKLRGAKDIKERVAETLEQVGLTHVAGARPQTLSGGELQRASIARALILQPDVLLLDEPTSNLDPHNIQMIEGLLHAEKTRNQTTIIMATHNIFQARRLADRVALIWDGGLVEVATTDCFFNAPQDARTRAFTSGEMIY